jgi:uncharacterized membrane protein (UPF0127 family)
MIKIVLIVIFLAILVTLDSAIYVRKYLFISKDFKDYKLIRYKLENRRYWLLVADNEEKWTKGLMNQKELRGADGMLFVFKDKQIRSFWNKNTYLPLHIYWLDDAKVVGQTSLPSISESETEVIVQSPQPVDKVVELVEKK